MGWFFLLLAGLMEVAWPVGINLAEQGKRPIISILLALLAILLSGVFLGLAKRSGIPMGTAYAVWTGIGAIGTFLIGMAFFGEPVQTSRFLCVGLILAGVVGLKVFAH